MRAVLGMAFILVGALIGYQVLTGKFPATIAVPVVAGATTTTSDTPSTITGSQINSRYRNQNGSMGLPTMAALNDLASSNGGYQ